jgi:manganese/zinc/iron transport system substrate-binding protein
VRAAYGLALACGVAALVAACGRAEPDAGDGRLRVVATTSLVGDLAREIGGDAARVVALMGPGIDPHLYIASEGDVRRLSQAELILYSGLQLESKMASVLERIRGRTRVAAVTDGVARQRLLMPAEFEGAHDPHVWFDVALWAQSAAHVAGVLADADPSRAEEYRTRGAAYVARLDTLDGYVRAQAARVPQQQRVLVTAHDAFNYFGRAYGFEVRGLQGISTAAEAGTADVQALAQFIAERRIPAIFVESSVSPRAIEAVRAAVRARGWEVRLGGELYSDALGSPDGEAATYEGMIRHNIDTIVAALLERPGADDE